MANRSRSPSNGVQKAIWASKIFFFLLGILSVVWLAVPPTAGVFAPALPRLWASLCSCFAPPYLFVVVHLIILVIWKLSDQKHRHWEHGPVEEKPPEATDAVEIKSFESAPPPPAAPAVPLSPRPTPLALPQIPPSPATAKPIDPDSAGSQLSDDDLLDDEAESWEENDSMEATWKAIIEKTPRGAEKSGPKQQPPPPPPPPPPLPAAAIRARLPSVTGGDELNRRFDDFIKKRRDQIQLQRHESNQRRLQMMDSEFH